MCEAPKFARHLKWACPNRKWACPSKNGRGPVKREARGICRICHVVNPALDEGPTLETLDFTIRIGSTPTFCTRKYTYLPERAEVSVQRSYTE